MKASISWPQSALNFYRNAPRDENNSRFSQFYERAKKSLCFAHTKCFMCFERLLQQISTIYLHSINPLMPNDPYSGRTAPLTSKVAFYVFILQI